jgi:hypothetical protein
MHGVHELLGMLAIVFLAEEAWGVREKEEL